MRLFAVFFSVVLLFVSTRIVFAGQSDVDEVLTGIPAIARAFAPVTGVKWQDFANVLAGICAVESGCDPTMKHMTRDGKYSQYQGLMQMNDSRDGRRSEVAKAEVTLAQILPKIKQNPTNDPEQQKAIDFVVKAIDQARNLDTSLDRRFLPAYGIVLGAAKHIYTNKVLADEYPNPVLQAAGHLTAQFSGITEGKIKARQFSSRIGGCSTCVETEAWALAANKVTAGSTVDEAIRYAASPGVYGNKMRRMMDRMSLLTNGLTLVPDAPPAFNAPPFQAGPGPTLDIPYNGQSALMESGMMRPIIAPPYQRVGPPQTSGVTNPSQNPFAIGAASTQNNTSQGIDTSIPPNAIATGDIFTQSKTVALNGQVSLVWTTVNMSRSRPCAVTLDGKVVGNVNEGSKQFPAKLVGVGDHTYKLLCATFKGTSFTKSDTFTVQ